jgi:hypothetical protein
MMGIYVYNDIYIYIFTYTYINIHIYSHQTLGYNYTLLRDVLSDISWDI